MSLLDWASRHPGRCILLVALATFGIRAALLPVHGFPAPASADEFSYLLGSDTFAAGRLSNPAHPLAASFESLQMLVRPRYASKYQPGQALFLAFGQKFLGHPFYGVMISAALMNAALCWMLFGWTNRRWALLMSLYPVLFFTASQYWMDSYWGGAVPALGAALVLGAFPRLLRCVRPGAAALFTLGLSLLFLTRPYEGGALAATVILLLACNFKRLLKPPSALLRWPMVFPLLILLAAAIFQLSLNRSVTGSMFELPYALHLRTYEVAPVLWVVPGGQPPHRLGTAPAVLAKTYAEYLDYRHIRDALPWSFFPALERPAQLVFFLCYPVLLLPFLLAPLRKDRLLRALAVCALACYISLVFETWSFVHYAAPLFVVTLAFIGRALWKTSLRLSPRPRRALAVAAAAFLILAPLARHGFKLQRELTGHGSAVKFAVDRAALEDSLLASGKAASGQRQLVFVRYLPDHNTDSEWVYNKADIDNSLLIWARDLGPEQNNRVIAYYGKSRRYWLLEADEPVLQLKDYDAGQPR